MLFNLFELNHMQQNHSPDSLTFLFSPLPDLHDTERKKSLKVSF